MRVVVASDKFNGSLTAEQVAHHVAVGLRRVVPDLEVVQLPVADGGDGTLAATCAAGFELVPVRAEGPTGVEVGTGYAVRDGVAVVELADVSGLAQLPGNTFAPMAASSYGTGQVLRAALDAGCRQLVLGVGGSACTDAGAGMVQALGGGLYDGAGADIGRGGGALSTLHRIDLADLHPRWPRSRVPARAQISAIVARVRALSGSNGTLPISLIQMSSRKLRSTGHFSPPATMATLNDWQRADRVPSGSPNIQKSHN